MTIWSALDLVVEYSLEPMPTIQARAILVSGSDVCSHNYRQSVTFTQPLRL